MALIPFRDELGLTAREANLQGHPDENYAAFALKNGRVLLTCDRDYLDEQHFPLIHCPVIVVCDFGSGSSDEMRQTFRCLRTMSSFPQVFDKWTKIDARRESWTEHCRFLNGILFENSIPHLQRPDAGIGGSHTAETVNATNRYYETRAAKPKETQVTFTRTGRGD
jgi:Domain of unknown function (DUF5615)